MAIPKQKQGGEFQPAEPVISDIPGAIEYTGSRVREVRFPEGKENIYKLLERGDIVNYENALDQVKIRVKHLEAEAKEKYKGKAYDDRMAWIENTFIPGEIRRLTPMERP